MELKSLLRPSSVAVVGASEKLGFGRDAAENLRKGDLEENLYFVNPKRDMVLGQKCYASLSEIGKPMDLVVICTPLQTVNGILKEAAELGCRAAVVYASGYSEAGEAGKRAQDELKEVAQKYDMAVCGPNCGGFINNVDGVYAFGLLMPERRGRGNIGLVSQSGQVCSLLTSVPYLNFSYAISSGNNAVVGVEDYLEFLVDDEDTKVIAVYLEGIKKPEKFVKILAKAAKFRKPILALKAGASEKARQTTTAHTGSLAGSDASFTALFKKFGVVRVDDMEDLVNTCLAFSTINKKAANKNLAILNVSGGEAAISADVSQDQKVSLAELSKETLKKIQNMLPGYATPNNPLDMTATLVLEQDKYEAAVRAIMLDENVGMIAMGHNPDEKIKERDRKVDFGFAEILCRILEEGNKPIVLLPGMSRKRDMELREYYAKRNIPIFDNPKYGLSALRRYADYCTYDPDQRTLEVAVTEKTGAKKQVLSEHESKEILMRHGITVPKEEIAKTQEEALEIADRLGYPLVMKIESSDIPHKSDVGGVRLHINSREEVSEAYEGILESVTKKKPEAVINGVLVQQMLPKGTELIVGVTRDEQFGPMVLTGFGGVLTEIFKDTAVYPAPLNKEEALEMIHSLKVSTLLKGYRGSKPLDIDALAELIVQIGDLTARHETDIKELDMNPVFIYESGVAAADALIVKE